MIKEKYLSKAVRILCMGSISSLAIGLATLPAQAQDGEKVHKVEITGSSIKRIAQESGLPVQTFSLEDIQKTGVTSMADFVQQLPVMQGFTVASESVGGGGWGGMLSVSIHDVGSRYTLVLLNGRRMAASGTGSTVNVSSIPMSAVERVEVLTDGASALYGSDAIAGVVNFILKKGATPVEIAANISTPQHPGGGQKNISISKGFGDIEKDGYNAMVAFARDHSDPLAASQRQFGSTGFLKFKDQSGRELSAFNGSTRGNPANASITYYKYDPVTLMPIVDANGFKTAVTKSFNPYQIATGKCAANHALKNDPTTPDDRNCYFDYASSVEIYPTIERDSFFASGSLNLGRSGFKVFGDLVYTDSTFHVHIAPYTGDFTLKNTSPLWSKYITPNLSAGEQANLKGSTASVRYRISDLGPRGYDQSTKAVHIVSGVDGNAYGWDINSAISYSRSKLNTAYNGYLYAAPWKAAIAAGTYDPFAYITGQSPAAQKEALLAMKFNGQHDVSSQSVTAWDVRASRELFSLPGGQAMLGTGFDTRATKFIASGAPGVDKGELLSESPFEPYSYAQRTSGAYAELLAPISKQLEATASFRFDSISKINNNLTGENFGDEKHATTYKLSTRYQPTKELLLRASYGTGFKAPSVLDVVQPVGYYGQTSESYDCPFTAKTGLANHPLAQYCTGHSPYETLSGGNPKIKPEKSEQWSFGAVFAPLESFSAGFDYWNVVIKNSSSYVGITEAFANPGRYLDLFTTTVVPDTNETALAFIYAPTNAGKSEMSGIDYNARYSLKLGAGKLDTYISGTYMLRSRVLNTSGDVAVWDTSMGGGDYATTFRNKISLGSSYTSGNWTNGLSLSFQSEHRDTLVNNCTVKTVDTRECHDTQLHMPSQAIFNWQSHFRVSKDIDFTLNIANLFDRQPNLSLAGTNAGHQIGYDGRYSSPIGRSFGVSGKYRF